MDSKRQLAVIGALSPLQQNIHTSGLGVLADYFLNFTISSSQLPEHGNGSTDFFISLIENRCGCKKNRHEETKYYCIRNLKAYLQMS